MRRIFGCKCSVNFLQENRPNFGHRKLHHILRCKKGNVSPGAHSGSILASPTSLCETPLAVPRFCPLVAHRCITPIWTHHLNFCGSMPCQVSQVGRQNSTNCTSFHRLSMLSWDERGNSSESLTQRVTCQKVHSFQKSSSIVSVLPAALRAGASPPIPLALSCHWDGGGVGTIEHVSKGWEGFVPSWFKSTSSQHVEFGGRVGIRKGSEEIAALACAGRVKATISLNMTDQHVLKLFAGEIFRKFRRSCKISGIMHDIRTTTLQKCRVNFVNYLLKYSECHIFQGWASEPERFTKCHAKSSVKNGRFHISFTLLGGGGRNVIGPPIGTRVLLDLMCLARFESQSNRCVLRSHNWNRKAPKLQIALIPPCCSS